MKLLKFKKAFVLIAIALVSIVVLFLFREFISNYLVKINMGKIEVPPKGSKILVFAPHNDDETLGSGAFIKMAVQNGCSVKLVLVTNGDGFTDALKFDYLKIMPKKTDYINFGYARQKETIAAMKVFGLQEDDIIFLGYPDGGMSHLWNYNWDQNDPYTSKFTKTDISPYRNSYTTGAVYCGRNAADDIIKIIQEYKPDYMVYPHPNDRHPDHWAVNAFIKYALARTDYAPKEQWLYLVHRGDWPTPMKKDTSMFLVPPAKLASTGTKWYAVDMNSETITQKTTAIHMYKTQITLLRFLMTAFERKNEMFGEYSDLAMADAERSDNEIAARNDNMVIADPLQDAINLKISKSSDISGVYAEVSKQNNIHFFIKMDSDIEEAFSYNLNLVFINKDITKHMNIVLHKNKLTALKTAKDSITDISGVKFSIKGKMISFTIPGDLAGDYSHVFVNASTSMGNARIDKTAWRMLNRN